MKKHLLLCVVLLVAGTLPGRADQTGLAAIHELDVEHGKQCMSGHYHEGTGTGATRKAAEASAASAWGSFVALEYGSDWAHFAYAGSRSMTCKNSGGVWSCDSSGRPCLRRVGAVRTASLVRARSLHRVRYVRKSH